MLSSTLKRSAATLGVVVAGLLAAAGPASAQLPPTTNGVTAPAGPTAEAQLLFKGEMVGLEPAMSAGISGQEMSAAVKAPTSPTSEVFTSVSNVAPLHGDATTIWVWHEAARNGAVTNRDSAGHQTKDKAVVVPIGPNTWTHGDDRNPGNCCD